MKSVMRSDEFAKFIGRNEKTVRRWCNDGALPAVRAGSRWYVNVEEWLKPTINQTGNQDAPEDSTDDVALDPKFAHLKYC